MSPQDPSIPSISETAKDAVIEDLTQPTPVLESLQSAILTLLGLSASYHLFCQDARKHGYRMARKFDQFGEDCEAHVKILTELMMQLGGEPSYEVIAVYPEETIEATLAVLLQREKAFVASCARWAQTCQDEGDMTAFLLFQKLATWAEIGSKKYHHRIHWLLKTFQNLKKLGETDFITTEI